MLIIHKKYFSSYREGNTKLVIAEVFFALSVVFFTIVVFSSLQYFSSKQGTSFLFYPMMLSAVAFFVPMLVWYSFDAAYKIPAPVYTTWYYPIGSTIDLPPDNPKEKLLVIGFELAKKSADIKRTYFRAKSPEGLELGELYYHFINDYNELHPETPIEITNNDQEPYEWLFRMKNKWYQYNSILDPTISIRDNGIRENTVILCDRVN
jgi:hypothetical protein